MRKTDEEELGEKQRRKRERKREKRGAGKKKPEDLKRRGEVKDAGGGTGLEMWGKGGAAEHRSTFSGRGRKERSIGQLSKLKPYNTLEGCCHYTIMDQGPKEPTQLERISA